MSDPRPSEFGAADHGWLRLDNRMLLLGPARAAREFALPAVIAVIGITSTGASNPMWLVPGVIGLIVVGAVPWFTTAYRMTATHFQLRRGLINKEQLTAPLDRIRSVDLESSLLHRALGLSKVQIGTGVDDTRIELNALSVERAEQLRVTLLARVDATTPIGYDDPVDAASDLTIAPPEAVSSPRAPAVELATLDWAWLRFAPFSLGRLVLLAGIFGVIAQFGDDFPILGMEAANAGWRRLMTYAVPAILLVGSLTAVVAWLVLSGGGFVLQWWNFRLVRDNGSLRLTAGLLTTRSISIEEQRIRGVELTEPGLLRLVGGAELSALATGVGSGGATTVLPPAPRSTASDVGARILDLAPDSKTPDPIGMPLNRHGRFALRRCLLRSQLPALGALVVGVPIAASTGGSAWIVLAVTATVTAAGGLWIGRMAYQNLGHARTPHHLVAGDGWLRRRRTVLEADGVIGWVVKQSWFQRRVGLATLVATTAAGAEEVLIRDLPEPTAIALADAITPGVLTEFALG